MISGKGDLELYIRPEQVVIPSSNDYKSSTSQFVNGYSLRMSSPLRILPLHLACQLLVSQNNTFPANDTYDVPLPKLATELPGSYTVYPDIGVAYRFYENAVPWDTARKYCNVHGANLAVIDSYEKVQHLRRMKTGDEAVYVGIHRLFDPNEWTDIRTGSAAEAIPWRSEPYVEDTARRCAALFYDGDGLYAKVCSLTASFVCEVPIFRN